MAERPGKIRTLFPHIKAGGLLLTHPADVRWATGFTGTHGLALVTPDQGYLIAHPLNAELAEQTVTEAEIIVAKGRMVDELKQLPLPKTLAFQSDHLTLAETAALKKRVSGVRWKPITSALADLRARKSPEEIRKVRKALRITETVFSEILKVIKPGMTEREVATEIVYRQLKHGAELMPEGFDPIVGSGTRSAIPHAGATAKKFKNGELVVLDFGCVVEGYCSDLTRTVAIGDPGTAARRAYQTVLRAQKAAISRAKAGVSGKTVDASARSVIDTFGKDVFPTATGHGVGLEVHELPVFAPRWTRKLPENAVMTVEPGIYIKGKFGIRIEDMVVLEKNSCQRLNRSTRDLIQL